MFIFSIRFERFFGHGSGEGHKNSARQHALSNSGVLSGIGGFLAYRLRRKVARAGAAAALLLLSAVATAGNARDSASILDAADVNCAHGIPSAENQLSVEAAALPGRDPQVGNYSGAMPIALT
ncbi:MAG: hypothetical protein KKA44_11125 [Alphaproteobacteria bacterium]|nr:hypothetical protein [Alphaproteobacteria bacterium]MBU0863724.1 hypothetical protein [Alphaproteobacteria bacterium]MBU1825514.1 hypothetical protein [Alphaproteobacteria bacterium]